MIYYIMYLEYIKFIYLSAQQIDMKEKMESE